MAPTEESDMADIILKLMRPGSREPQDVTINVNLSSTVQDLRNKIQETVPGIPDANSLRLIYGGRQLRDENILKEAFRARLDSRNPVYVHVVIRPSRSPPRAAPAPGRGFFSPAPAASRANATSATPTPTVPQNQTPGSTIPGVHNLPPGTPPGTAMLLQASRGRPVSFSYTRRVTTTTTSTFVHTNRTSHDQNVSSGSTSGGPSEIPSTPRASPQQEYYLLQGPDGQGAILLAPAQPGPPLTSGPSHHREVSWGSAPLSPSEIRNRRRTNPVESEAEPSSETTPPGENLEQSQDVAREIIRLRKEILERRNRFQTPAEAAELEDLERRRVELMRQHTSEFRELRAPLVSSGARAQVPRQRPAPVRIRIRPRGPMGYFFGLMLLLLGVDLLTMDERAIERALNWLLECMWLALKLGFGVYLLGGGRDTRRDIILWSAATIIFLAQSGIARVILRRYRIMPLLERIGAFLADPAPRPVPAAAQGNDQQQQPAQGQQGGEPHPQQLADRLIQQRNNQQEGGLWDNIQASVGIFMASLIPGLGERVGQARRLRQEALQAIEGGQAGEQAQAQGDVGGVDGQGQEGQAAPDQPQVPAQQDPDVQPLFGL
ncbi:hypothetical protein TWF481_011941 [Arthrobotrys musiformis]|uniref:Ubiquitin-like domain-containing protein n=1 Tax=Arthrobotrys musiformis TaxID=47236 RepID=A0AAV9VXD7_9PEZI